MNKEYEQQKELYDSIKDIGVIGSSIGSGVGDCLGKHLVAVKEPYKFNLDRMMASPDYPKVADLLELLVEASFTPQQKIDLYVFLAPWFERGIIVKGENNE